MKFNPSSLIERILNYLFQIDEYTKFSISQSYWHGVYCKLIFKIQEDDFFFLGWHPDDIDEATINMIDNFIIDKKCSLVDHTKQYCIESGEEE